MPISSENWNDGHEYKHVYEDDYLTLGHTAATRYAIVKKLEGLYDLRIDYKVGLFLRVQLKWELNSQGFFSSINMYQPQ